MIKKKIAIIGAGFTGLTAALRLSQAGNHVTILEKESQPGGLAIGFKGPGWQWQLEKHYHHLFVSDWVIRNLAAEIGHSIVFTRPKTSTWIDGVITQLDSPASLLKFTHLPLLDRLRTAAGLGLLKFNPLWYPFEYFTAKKYIQTIMGEKSWQKLWEPLFDGKFGTYTDQISAVWFWARIYKRSASLGYPEGGFQSLSQSIANSAQKQGSKFIYNTQINSLTELKKFDKIICTLPTPLFSKISGLQYQPLPGLGAVNLVLALKKQFFTDGTYWLNVNDRKIPFLCIAEHTHFVSPSHYNNNHLVYVGNYLPSSHEFFKVSNKELLRLFLPHLQKINPHFTQDWVINSWVWKASFAQPIVTTRYSKLIPPLTTSIPNLYLANI